MPRANRFHLPSAVRHITHRCHDRSFLLTFERDLRRRRCWLFKARKRHGLPVLNYITTSNHVHLLVQDRGNGEIARSMRTLLVPKGYHRSIKAEARDTFRIEVAAC